MATSILICSTPIVFNFPGYAALIYKLDYRRANHPTCTCTAIEEKGSIDTPLGLTI